MVLFFSFYLPKQLHSNWNASLHFLVLEPTESELTFLVQGPTLAVSSSPGVEGGFQGSGGRMLATRALGPVGKGAIPSRCVLEHVGLS